MQWPKSYATKLCLRFSLCTTVVDARISRMHPSKISLCNFSASLSDSRTQSDWQSDANSDLGFGRYRCKAPHANEHVLRLDLIAYQPLTLSGSRHPQRSRHLRRRQHKPIYGSRGIQTLAVWLGPREPVQFRNQFHGQRDLLRYSSNNIDSASLEHVAAEPHLTKVLSTSLIAGSLSLLRDPCISDLSGAQPWQLHESPMPAKAALPNR